jgi:hypothetical protein
LERQRSNRYSTGCRGWLRTVTRKLPRAEAAGVAVEDGEVEDDEEVLVVLVDLRPLVARGDVLEVEGVEVEVLLQPCLLGGAGAVELHPSQPLGRDLLYLWGARVSALGYDKLARRSAGTAQAWAREARDPPLARHRPGCSSLWCHAQACPPTLRDGSATEALL